MDIFLSLLALVLSIGGILGAILPALPGLPLSWLAMLCVYNCSYSTITPTQLYVWLGIAIVLTVVDNILPAYITKKMGGSRSGVIGATLGILAGFFFFPPVGVILCPFFGAVLGELLHDKNDVGRAFVIGFGSFLSFIVGTGMKLIAAVWMLAYFIGDILDLTIASCQSAFNWIVSLF